MRYKSHLSSQVLEDSSRVDSGGSSDTSVRSRALLEETVDSSHGELQTGASRTGDHLIKFGFNKGWDIIFR